MRDPKAMLLSFGVSLGLTLLIETALALLSKKRGPQLLFVVLANCFTNPAVVLATRLFGTPAFITGEVFAVTAEWLIYRYSGARFKRPFLFSLTLNAVSCSFGLLLNVLTHS